MRGCVSAFAFEGATRGWVLAGEGRLVQNTRQLTGPEADEEREYGSLAVAPVYAGNSLFGLFTVDAKPVNGLTSFHQKLLLKYGSSLRHDVRGAGRSAEVTSPKNTTFDATYSERIKLLEMDPEQYFAKYRWPRFDFSDDENNKSGRRKKRW